MQSGSSTVSRPEEDQTLINISKMLNLDNDILDMYIVYPVFNT